MKRFLLVVAIIVLIGYLAFTAFYFKGNVQDKVCENFVVLVRDSLDKKFIQTKDIDIPTLKQLTDVIYDKIKVIENFEDKTFLDFMKIINGKRSCIFRGQS